MPLRLGFVLLLLTSTLAAQPPARPVTISSTSIHIDYDVRVPMRDGKTLSADVYRPKGDAPVPVILVRTPYDNGVAAHVADGKRWASRGYAYVVQDVRGRGESDGEFYPADYRGGRRRGHHRLAGAPALVDRQGRDDGQFVSGLGAALCGHPQARGAQGAHPDGDTARSRSQLPGAVRRLRARDALMARHALRQDDAGHFAARPARSVQSPAALRSRSAPRAAR